MNSSNPRNRIAFAVALIVFAAALAGCETAGSGPKPEAAKPPDPPMTHQRAATECWMSTEKAKADLDKRADIVTKCIDQKMKAAADAPKT